eukprot:TRINITY_DN3533_c1_g1_i1.p1 TRINITY_DN3533_c1_g1~~TRINITY_DN3533_c1_g1_i1.p1  ORF type:complete len:550 (+),score=119.11 TRINITY_DN3533_c1_g1_i1:57-1706(+)
MSFRAVVARFQVLRGSLSTRGAVGETDASLLRAPGLLQSPARTLGEAGRWYNAAATESVPKTAPAVKFPDPTAVEVNYCSTLEDYNTMLYQCCDEKRVATRGHLLRDIYSDMMMDGVRPNRHTYQICIGGISRTKHAHDAFFFFDEMKAHGIAANVTVYNSLILAAGRCFEPKRAFKIAEEMEANGFKPSVLTYMFLLKVCGDAGRVAEAEGVRQRMLQQGYSLTRFSYVSLIDAQKNSRHRHPTPNILPSIFSLLEEWRAGQKQRLGTEEKAQPVAEKEEAEAGTEATGPEKVEVVKEKEKEKVEALKYKEALQLDSFGKNLREEQAVYNAAMAACIELHHPEGMQKIIEIMKEDNVPANRETYMVLFKYYLLKDSSMTMAKQMWEEMRNLGQISMEYYLDAIESVLRKSTSSSARFALELLEEYLGKGNYLNMHHGSQLLTLACKNKSTQDMYVADRIWAAMETSKYHPKYDAAIAYVMSLTSRGIGDDDPRVVAVRKLVRQRSYKPTPPVKQTEKNKTMTTSEAEAKTTSEAEAKTTPEAEVPPEP